MKVYLAGGFFHDEDDERLDWRYSMVDGLTEEAPYLSRGKGLPHKWGVLENAIGTCFDYVGPYKEHQFDGGLPYFCKLAILEADIVFAWIDQLSAADISKVSAEIAYAYAFEKPVAIGTPDEDSDTMRSIWFVDEFKDFSTFPYVDSSPFLSFLKFFLDAFPFFPTEDKIAFRNKNNASKELLGNRLKQHGYVYIIQAEMGQYKIGRTRNIPKRMNLFGVKLPFKFEIIHHFPCDNMYLAEKELHRTLLKYHVNGEWFDLPADVISLLVNIVEYTVFDEEEEITYFVDKDDITIDFNMNSLDEIISTRKNRLNK